MKMQTEFFKFDDRIKEEAARALQICRADFDRIEETAEYNGQKVLAAFIRNIGEEVPSYA